MQEWQSSAIDGSDYLLQKYIKSAELSHIKHTKCNCNRWQ